MASTSGAVSLASHPPVFAAVLRALGKVAPLKLAAKWDNVGLLVDTTRATFPTPFRVFLTNDLTEKVVDEAVTAGSHLIVTYHPTPFRGLKRVVRTDPVGRVVLKCLGNSIAVYSTHTAADSVPGGVNDWLIGGLGTGTVVPAQPDDVSGIEGAGLGRVMTMTEPTTLADVIARTKSHLGLSHVRVAIAMTQLTDRQCTAASVGDAASSLSVSKVAVCAGSGASVLDGVDADVYVTGEMSHHEVLKANASGATVILTDHSNTERGFLPTMREKLAAAVEAELGAGAGSTAGAGAGAGAGSGGDVDIVITKIDADPLIVL